MASSSADTSNQAGAPGQIYTAPTVYSTLAGTGGADTFNGSEAGDTITGGAGGDLFHFSTKPWDPSHITDFEVGADKLDLSDLLTAAGYTGSDPIADQYIRFMDNGAGGTKVLFDRDGAGAGQPWPDRILELDNLAYDPADAGRILAGSSSGGGTANPPPTIALAPIDLTHAEGATGAVTFAYTVTRSGDVAGASTVHWAVTGSGASAASASDFTGGALPQGDLTFSAGETTKTVTVEVAGDTAVEADEGFTITLSNVSAATLGTATASGMITNDDAAPGDGDGGGAGGGATAGAGQVYTATTVHSTLTGTRGADTFNASEAGDTLTGAAGGDLFRLGAKPWDPIHVTDFEVGSDKLDLSSLLRQVGYTGFDPIADRYVIFADNGAGGTKVMFDRDGAGDVQVWPDRIVELENLVYDPANDAQILSASAPPPSTADSAYVLFAGQSNTGGNYTTASEVDPDWKPDPLTFIWHHTANTWVQLEPGTNTGWSEGEQPNSWGPEVEFAIQFRAAHPDTPLYILKEAHGGTNLYSDWDPDNAGHLFDKLTTLVDEAGASLGGRKPDILFWGQGETDGTTETMAQAYSQNLPQFFDAARSSWLGDPDGKIAFFEIDTTTPYSNLVRDAQVQVDQADANASSFDTAGFPLQSDNIHFTAAALDAVGARYFELYQGWATGAGSPPPPAPTLALTTTSVSHAEGASGSTPFAFTLARAGGSTGASSAHWAVTGSGSNAASGSDFVGGALPQGDVTFAAGETSKTITVTVAGDTAVEADEGFTVTLSNVSGATLGTATASGLIGNDDTASGGGSGGGGAGSGGGQVYTAPTVYSTLTGTGGADTFNGSEAGDTITGGAGGDLFHFSTKPWDPSHITDFQVGADKLDLSDLLKAAGYTGSDPVADQYIRFMDNGAGGTKVLFDRDGAGAGQPWPDRILELDNLAYDPADASQILAGSSSSGGAPPPPPTAPTLALTTTRLTLAEGASGSTAFAYTVTRSGDTSAVSTVHWTVGGSGANAAGASDFAGGALPQGDLAFSAGETSKTITVNVAGDPDVEADEGFTITLSNVSGATLGTVAASGLITNDDTAPGAGGGGASGGAGGGSTGSAGQVYAAPAVYSRLGGSGGDDTFIASEAGDTLTGGAGLDLFDFNNKPWDPAHITDFDPSSDHLDLSDLLKAVGYAGSDPVADRYVLWMDNGAGGTKIFFDRDGVATGQQWPDRIIELDNLPVATLNAASAGWLIT